MLTSRKESFGGQKGLGGQKLALQALRQRKLISGGGAWEKDRGRGVSFRGSAEAVSDHFGKKRQKGPVGGKRGVNEEKPQVGGKCLKKGAAS